ncbi:MAG TPA: PocR ligand-binding domain-containing protein [Opitutaceae bacterium]|jgi:AraC-like DNA-binding protein/ligand-binding sensor protein|nr:PocR ligand-binding domain-containing protein [Opitutaceae bacterium]
MSNEIPSPRSRSKSIVEHLKASPIWREYEKAFADATGLPLGLRPVETFQFPLAGHKNENPFCALLAQTNKSCSACLQMQQEIAEAAKGGAQTLRCFAGLCDTAVPVRVGENLIAFLQTGQVFLHQPSKSDFSRVSRQLLEWGREIDVHRIEEAYFQTRVIPKRQYESIVRLLVIFSQHLAALSNQLMVREETAEAPMVARARSYITDHQSEELSLKEVARAVNTSAFYFCKMFKQATGLTFTDYLARVRVEKVKNLLLNPHKRISEAAFEAGFQSLSQFNRVFKKIEGLSPSDFRDQLHPITDPAAI